MASAGKTLAGCQFHGVSAPLKTTVLWMEWTPFSRFMGKKWGPFPLRLASVWQHEHWKLRNNPPTFEGWTWRVVEWAQLGKMKNS